MSKADGNHQSLQEKVEAMEKDLQKLARPEEIPKRLQATDDTFGAELHKVKALVAAAGANFNKQIKDLRQQVKGLREETTQASGPVGLGSLEERWPGRGVSNGPPSDAGSEQCSDVGSVTASLAGSVVAGMAPEEKAELRKMQVVVSAAATTFSKDIKEVRKCLGEVQADLSNLKAMAGLNVPFTVLQPLKANPDLAARVSVVGLASLQKSEAEAACKEWGIEKAYAGFEEISSVVFIQELLADPAVDAVYNALPVGVRCHWTVKAILAGKHVLCETPSVMNGWEAVAAQRAAEDL
eukprot:g21153.t1